MDSDIPLFLDDRLIFDKTVLQHLSTIPPLLSTSTTAQVTPHLPFPSIPSTSPHESPLLSSHSRGDIDDPNKYGHDADRMAEMAKLEQRKMPKTEQRHNETLPGALFSRSPR